MALVPNLLLNYKILNLIINWKFVQLYLIKNSFYTLLNGITYLPEAEGVDFQVEVDWPPRDGLGPPEGLPADPPGTVNLLTGKIK